MLDHISIHRAPNSSDVYYSLFLPLEFQVSKEKLKKLINVLNGNYIVIGLPFSIVHYYLQRWRGCDVTLTLPSLTMLITHIALCILIEEVGFYYTHRLFLGLCFLYRP